MVSYYMPWGLFAVLGLLELLEGSREGLGRAGQSLIWGLVLSDRFRSRGGHACWA